MDIGTLDYYANFGNSSIHRTSAGFKVVFAIFLVASVIITKSVILLSGIYIMLLSMILISGVPSLKVLILASYPGIFALIFAFASWNGNLIFSALIILKALTASLCMVLIIVSTSYPKIFSVLKPFMPRLIFDAVLLTYRSLILLMGLLSNLISALKVRGGFDSPGYLSRIKNLSSGMALLVVRGFDLSQNFYGILNIRGYEGKISYSDPDSKIKFSELIFILTGSFLLIVTIYSEEYNQVGTDVAFLLISSIFLIITILRSVFIKSGIIK